MFKCTKNKVTTSVQLALTASLLMSTAALAEETGSEKKAEETIEVITVEASRRSEKLIEVPTSLTVLDNDEAIKSGITDINGLAGVVPNLNAIDGGAPGLGNLTIRGIYAGGASTVGIYIDDVPYGPVIGGAGNSLAFDGSLLDLQQIEVVRGPQGTLFGSSSMGGVVRYITKDPVTDYDEIEGSVSADFSSTDKGGTNTIYRGNVSIPLIDDVLAISLSGFSEESDGFTDLPLLGTEDVNGSSFTGGTVGVSFKPTEDFSAKFKYIAQEAEYGDSGFEAFDPATGKALWPDYAPLLGMEDTADFADLTATPSERDYSFNLTALTLEYDLGFASIKSITSQQEIELNIINDITAQLGPIADAFAPGTAPHTVSFNSPKYTERFTQEFHLSSADSDSLEWIVGAYYTSQDTDDQQIATVTPNDVHLLTANIPTEYEETAVFGNVTYYVSKDFDVTAGVRYSDSSNTISSTGDGVLLPPGSLPAGTEQQDTVTNYLFNARYRFSDELHAYARAASGFRPGGANLVFIIGGETYGEPFYQPDELWSYEAGLKGMLNNKLTWDVGYYMIDWADAQLNGTNPLTGLSYFANSTGNVESSGFEAAIKGELIEDFNISATFGLLNTEFTEDEPVLGAVAGSGLLAPEVTASFSGDYVFEVFNTTASIGATWRYTGESNSFYQGGTAKDGTPLVPMFENYENDAYSQIDLRAQVDLDVVDVNFYVANATNEDAYTSVFHAAPGYAQGLVLRPRTVGVNVSYEF